MRTEAGLLGCVWQRGPGEWPAERPDGVAIGKQFAGVIEADDPVAQEPPALLGVVGDDACGVVVEG
jgi:hypothetical protein